MTNKWLVNEPVESGRATGLELRSLACPVRPAWQASDDGGALNRQAPPAPRVLAGFGVRLMVWAVLTVLACMLARLAWVGNLERACTLEQWPVLPSCARQSADTPAQAQRLQARIARNPGDSQAWIALAVLSSQPGKAPGVNHDSVLDKATRLAGEDYRVQRLQAMRAIQRQHWPQAVDWLVRLVQDSGDRPASVALAALVPQPQALAAMQAQLKPGARWLGPVVVALPQAGVPVVLVMPLVVGALAQRGLPPQTIQWLVRRLQAENQWLQAHALWTAWLGHPVALLFNGHFDQGWSDIGFDWEVMPVSPTRAGALARQVALEAHGGVLRVDFTGRPVAVPVVRQHLVLLHRRYLLSGQFMTTRLRASEGLAWTLQCVKDGQEIARSPALKDTAGQWRPFSVEFDMPPSCGPAVALQLQTFASYQALAGLQGQAVFDDFTLEVRP